MQSDSQTDTAGEPRTSATPEDLSTLEKAIGSGATATFDALEEILRREKMFRELFEALLMRNRHELGLPLIQIGPATDIPDDLVRPHEDAIENACRVVGHLFLEDGDLVQAWPYLRAIGDSAPVKTALDAIEPGTRRKDIDRLIEVAMHEGVHPGRGLEFIVHHYGICNSITNFEQYQSMLRNADRQECARVLIRSLHRELVENIRAEVERREGEKAAQGSLSELIADRPDLFAGHAYYVDTSHLWSIIRFSNFLDDGEELDIAVSFCDYGGRLSDVYQYNSEPPFEDFYRDQDLYLRGIRACNGTCDGGEDPEEVRSRAAKHFAAKGQKGIDDGDPEYPMGSVLNVLVRLRAFDEAIDLAQRFETVKHPETPLTPSLIEVCQMAENFERLQSSACEKVDILGFAAGLVQAKGSSEG